MHQDSSEPPSQVLDHSFRRNIVVCTHIRTGTTKPSCQRPWHAATIETLGPQAASSGVRISRSHCLGMCSFGPVALVVDARKLSGDSKGFTPFGTAVFMSCPTPDALSRLIEQPQHEKGPDG